MQMSTMLIVIKGHLLPLSWLFSPLYLSLPASLLPLRFILPHPHVCSRLQRRDSRRNVNKRHKQAPPHVHRRLLGCSSVGVNVGLTIPS